MTNDSEHPKGMTAAEAGRLGAARRLANSTPEERREIAKRGGLAAAANRRRAREMQTLLIDEGSK